MKDRFYSRLFTLCGMFLVMFVVMAVKLGQMALAQDQEVETEVHQSNRYIDLKGNRGKILFSNGTPLAISQKSFDVVFLREDIETEAEIYRSLYTESIIKTIQLVEKNGFKTIDTFVIKKDDKGGFIYDFGVTRDDLVESRLSNWRQFMKLSSDKMVSMTVEQTYNYLRDKFYIPDDVSYEMALKVLSIWQEIQRNFYRKFEPVVIAKNVNTNTVAQIETKSNELIGIQIAEGSVRVYPKGETAAHVVGYLGKITDKEDFEKDLKPKGYEYNDMIGSSGIELQAEQYLTENTMDRKGKKTLQVTASGKVNRVIDEETILPRDGNDVILTLDLGLQQVTEAALKKNIEETRLKQEELFLKNYDKYLLTERNLDNLNFARYGSAVVLDAKTGAILSMVSYPSFNPELFSTGISNEEFLRLSDKVMVNGKAEDLPSNQRMRPLWNKAVSQKSAPGSIFKLAVALAGLEEGVTTIDRVIEDKGEYREHILRSNPNSKAAGPRCWNPNFHQHNEGDGNNVENAIKNSCNYYFYTVADELGIDKINKWTGLLGLDTKTGSDMPNEAEGQIGGQKVLFDKDDISEDGTPINDLTGTANLVRGNLESMLETYATQQSKKVLQSDITRCSYRLMALVDESRTDIGKEIRVIVREELGIPEAVSVEKGYDTVLASKLSELRWKDDFTVRTGIGQMNVLITPIEAARYMAALVNGGNVYETYLIDKVIDSQSKKIIKQAQPKLIRSLDVKKEHLDVIKKGMLEVVSPEDAGSAGDMFKGYKYKDDIGGKTGTAQILTGDKNIDIENTSYFLAFAPREDPEIVIAVCIPYGLSGSSSATTIKEIVTYYMDHKNAVAQNNIVNNDDIVQ